MGICSTAMFDVFTSESPCRCGTVCVGQWYNVCDDRQSVRFTPRSIARAKARVGVTHMCSIHDYTSDIYDWTSRELRLHRRQEPYPETDASTQKGAESCSASLIDLQLCERRDWFAQEPFMGLMCQCGCRTQIHQVHMGGAA